jgi:hypothetical protein
MRQTIAFDNSAEYWKTRYSFTPSCMMHVNKLFFTSPFQKEPSDDNKLIYRHNDSSTSFNTFYDSGGHSLPTAIGVSFNGYSGRSVRSAASNTSRSNKIFKSFSIAGLNTASSDTNLSLGASSFVVNNNSQDSNQGRHALTELERKGNSVYGNIGKEVEMSGTNIKAIGRIRNVYKWMSINEDGENIWRHLTTGEQLQPLVQIPGLHVDEFGDESQPILGISDELYAFEIESFMSNNPLPSTITGGSAGEYVKFFTGRLNANGTDMQSTPYVEIPSSPPYVPNIAEYQVNFQESINFINGDNYGSYLSFGDPYFNENNTFKKGNFLMIRHNALATSPHVRYERTPGSNAAANGFNVEFGEDNLAFQNREVLFAMTPGFVNGADPHGSFADAFVIFGSQDFEVSSLMVEYEFTEYDHGGLISGASKASGKK